MGTKNLNQFLQNIINPLNPQKLELKRGELILREGDGIIQKTKVCSEHR